MASLLTGYGPSGHARLCFNGDADKYEMWEKKFLGYLRLKKLAAIATKNGALSEEEQEKNIDVFAELIQYLDDTSLSIIMREASDDGRKSIKLLREHYCGTGKPRILALYSTLTSLQMADDEHTTDYVLRAEKAWTALKNAGEQISDSLIVAMLLKGLPDSFKAFEVYVTQSEKEYSVIDFRKALREFEEHQKPSNSILKVSSHSGPRKPEVTCFYCKKKGHKVIDCPKKKSRWCNNCKTKSHDTEYCRRKPGGGNSEKKDTTAQVEHFQFKVAVFDSVNSVAEPSDGSDTLVDCGATAHIITDRSKFLSMDTAFDPSKHTIELADGSRSTGIVQGKGKAQIKVSDEKGQPRDVTLDNALFIPSYNKDIFSVQAATAKGAAVNFTQQSAVLEGSDGTVFPIEKKGRLYYLCTVVSERTRPAEVWHKTMGHLNGEDLRKLPGVVENMAISGEKNFQCETCVLGKMPKSFNRAPDEKASEPLMLVHSDLAGPIDTQSKDGFKYVMNFVDDFSGCSFVYFLESKADAHKALEKFLADVAPFGSVKCIRSDNGTEYVNSRVRDILVKNKIKHERSAPYSPHQNGTAERHWLTLFNTARCMLIESGVEKSLWHYAVLSANYVRNRCYVRRLEKTPIEAFTGRKPDVSRLHVFGSICYGYVEEKKKLDARSRRGIFLGYDKESPAYQVLFPDENIVRRIRCVKFTEQLPQMEHDDLVVPMNVKNENVPVVPDTVENDVKDDTDVEPVNENVKTDVNDDVQGEGKGDKRYPQVQGEGKGDKRYPQRERQKPKYLDDYVSGEDSDDYTCTVDYLYHVSDVPKTYEEAVRAPDANFWEDAMNDEMSALKENNTFSLTELPEGIKAVGARWVYAKKENGDKELYKARLVAKGYSQTYGVDYDETFAPTAKLTTIRALANVAVQNHMFVHQMDVKSAYLNADIDQDVYMDQAKGYEKNTESGGRLVYKLNKSLYGLKQSGRNWNLLLNDFLLSIDFVRSQVDPCMYTKGTGKGKIILVTWVDDMIVTCADDVLLNETKDLLKSKFKMKDLGVISDFLGISFELGEGVIKMNQRKYVVKVLDKFGMTNCKPKSTPSEQKLVFSDEAKPFDSNLYRQAIGSLIYLMVCTRPDISYIVSKLSQYCENPTDDHWIAVKHVFRYLKGTMDYSLCFYKCTDSLKLTGYSDADWAGASDRKSTSGYCFKLNEDSSVISWKSRKQPTVALSTCEAEYIAVAVAVQEAIFLKRLLYDMCVSCDVCMFSDNQGTIALTKNPIVSQRSKHIDIKYHFIRDVLQQGTMTLDYVESAANVADVMTKPMSAVKLTQFKKDLFGLA